MRIFWSVVIGLIVLLIIGYFVVKNAVDNLSFKFDLKGIDPSSLSLSGILKGEGTISAVIATTVSNGNGFGININAVDTEIYYQNQLVARSAGQSSRIHIDANKDTVFNHSMNVFINKYSLDLIKNIKSGAHPEITYKVNLKIFAVPFLIEDSHTF